MELTSSLARSSKQCGFGAAGEALQPSRPGAAEPLVQLASCQSRQAISQQPRKLAFPCTLVTAMPHAPL